MGNLSQSQIAPAGLEESFITDTFAGLGSVRLVWGANDFVSLRPWYGNTIIINGQTVEVSVTSTDVNINDDMIDANGDPAGATPAASTLYYAYVCNDPGNPGIGLLKLSATAPTALDTGVYYLGSTGTALAWRFVGAVLVTAAVAFEDSDTWRGVCSWLNPIPKRLFLCPEYSDNNADTTYTLNTATWAAVAATSSCTFIEMHSPTWAARASFSVASTAANPVQVGLSYKNPGITPGTDPAVAHKLAALVVSATAVPYARNGPATPDLAAPATVGLVAMTGGAVATFTADFARNGSTVDPPGTYLEGWVWC